MSFFFHTKHRMAPTVKLFVVAVYLETAEHQVVVVAGVRATRANAEEAEALRHLVVVGHLPRVRLELAVDGRVLDVLPQRRPGHLVVGACRAVGPKALFLPSLAKNNRTVAKRQRKANGKKKKTSEKATKRPWKKQRRGAKKKRPRYSGTRGVATVRAPYPERPSSS